MSRLPAPPHLPGAPAALVATFWTLVVFTLMLALSLVLFAGVDPVEAPGFGVAIVVLSILWALHIWAAHAHAAEIERDVRFRSARERRGF